MLDAATDALAAAALDAAMAAATSAGDAVSAAAADAAAVVDGATGDAAKAAAVVLTETLAVTTGLDAAGYTEASWRVFAEAIAAARAVSIRTGAPLAELQSVHARLTAALALLTPRPSSSGDVAGGLARPDQTALADPPAAYQLSRGYVW
ncbi:MAG: hypothetical protein LBK59_06100 [Bifidobacteriaceae bacterium]|nr:hypothetical protein [Bifidobacteriaceae bacterium]